MTMIESTIILLTNLLPLLRVTEYKMPIRFGEYGETGDDQSILVLGRFTVQDWYDLERQCDDEQEMTADDYYEEDMLEE